MTGTLRRAATALWAAITAARVAWPAQWHTTAGWDEHVRTVPNIIRPACAVDGCPNPTDIPGTECERCRAEIQRYTDEWDRRVALANLLAVVDEYELLNRWASPRVQDAIDGWRQP